MEPKVALQWGLSIIALIAVLSILKSFGIIGTSDEDLGTAELYNNPAMAGSNNALVSIKAAWLKKYGSPPTTAQIQAKLPSSGLMTSWRNELKKAAGFFNDNESGVFNVIRSIKTQLALYAFSQNFAVYEKKALLDYLAEFMDNEELSMINSIVEKFPAF